VNLFLEPKMLFLSVMQELRPLITVVHLIQRNYTVSMGPELSTLCHNHPSLAPIPGWWIKSSPRYLFRIYFNSPPRNRQFPKRSSSSQVVQLCINVPQFLKACHTVTCSASPIVLDLVAERSAKSMDYRSSSCSYLYSFFWRKIFAEVENWLCHLTAGIVMPILQNTVSNSKNTDQEMMEMNTKGKRKKEYKPRNIITIVMDAWTVWNCSHVWD